MTVTQQTCYHGLARPVSGAVRLYGAPGERCECGALLSAYNRYDRCCACGGGKKRPERRGEARSACREAAPNAAEPPRRVTTEEVEMAAAKRREKHEIDAAVRAFAEAQPWATYFTSRDCAAALGLGESTVKRRLTRLTEEGLLSSSARLGYALAKRSDPAPARPTGAAPAPPPEHPARPAAPTVTPLQEPPAAGPSIDHAMSEYARGSLEADGFQSPMTDVTARTAPPLTREALEEARDAVATTTGDTLSDVLRLELSRLHCAVPVTVTVEFDIDELAERVMELIAKRMTRDARGRW